MCSVIIIIMKIKLDCDFLKNSLVLFIELYLIYVMKRIVLLILVFIEKFVVLFMYMYFGLIGEDFYVSIRVLILSWL